MFCAACVVDVVNANKIKMLKAFGSVDFYFCIMSEISQVHKE